MTVKCYFIEAEKKDGIYSFQRGTVFPFFRKTSTWHTADTLEMPVFKAGSICSNTIWTSFVFFKNVGRARYAFWICETSNGSQIGAAAATSLAQFSCMRGYHRHLVFIIVTGNSYILNELEYHFCATFILLTLKKKRIIVNSTFWHKSSQLASIFNTI